MHLQSNTLILEAYVVFLKASGRNHNLFVLEAVGGGSSIKCYVCTHKYTHAYTNTFRLFKIFLIYSPKKLHIIPFSCVAGFFTIQSDTFKHLSPTLSLSLLNDHVEQLTV